MTRKYFGTDGIRGRVGKSPISPDFMLRLGWAVGKALGRKGKVLIGKDTRISGYMFESALEAGLSAAGVDVLLLGPMPTPAIAYLTRTFRAEAGIVISASHNAYDDNGVKFFTSAGTKLDDDIELAIEAELENNILVESSANLGKAVRIDDAAGRYIEFCKSTFPSALRLQGLKVVIDCAHGATYHVAPAVFYELGAEVTTIGAAPNGLNINKNVGSTHPQSLQKEVVDRQADLGIAFDGDGDRVIMVDHTGAIVDGDELLYIIAAGLQQRNKLKGPVVGTLMSNLGLEHALSNLGSRLKRAKVGDRYVLEMMRKTGAVIGGEGSGHIICLNSTTTGDGIISALQVLVAVIESGSSLHEIKSGMTKYPQTLINVEVSKRIDLQENRKIVEAVAQAEAELQDKGRILLRYSGTEPLVRVMVEGEDIQLVKTQAEKLAAVIKQQITG